MAEQDQLPQAPSHLGWASRAKRPDPPASAVHQVSPVHQIRLLPSGVGRGRYAESGRNGGLGRSRRQESDELCQHSLDAVADN